MSARRVEELADTHVAAFNGAVVSHDFTSFLARFDDDAAGRAAYAADYAQQPPDDQIRIAGPVCDECGSLMIPSSGGALGGPACCV